MYVSVWYSANLRAKFCLRFTNAFHPHPTFFSVGAVHKQSCSGCTGWCPPPLSGSRFPNSYLKTQKLAWYSLHTHVSGLLALTWLVGTRHLTAGFFCPALLGTLQAQNSSSRAQGWPSLSCSTQVLWLSAQKLCIPRWVRKVQKSSLQQTECKSDLFPPMNHHSCQCSHKGNSCSHKSGNFIGHCTLQVFPFELFSKQYWKNVWSHSLH